jgi:amino acid adenylation domain-containing protein
LTAIFRQDTLIPRVMTPSVFPASFSQQRLWFLDQLEPETAAYNLPRVFRIHGPLNVEVLTRAFENVIMRHAALRTVFDSVDGESRQIILPQANFSIPLRDLSELPEADQENEAFRIATAEGQKPFSLRQGPLLRAVLVRLKPETHILVLVLHHIVTDGWSISILFREVTKSYAAFSNGVTPDLPALTIQYSDYAQWQQSTMSGELLARELQHWREKLSGSQTLLDFPTDFSRPVTHTWRGATEEAVFDGSVLSKMKSLARAENATLFMVSLAAFQALLWRYTGQQNILLGTPVAGRNDIEIENMIGLFVNTLVFRTDFTNEMTFLDLTRQVRSFALEAYAHQDLPFERLVENLVPQRSLNTHPLFQMMFTFQNIPKQVFEIPGLSITELPFDAGIAKFDLSVEVWDDKQFHCQFEYNTDLFERSTMQRMLRHFEQLLNSALEKPDARLSQLQLMTAHERHQVLVEWNGTSAGYPRDRTIQAAFEEQAARTPNAIALIDVVEKWTYGQINSKANQLARLLAKKGVSQNCFVGVALPRSAKTTVAILAVLKTGAAYVPLDPALPSDRLRFMIEDASLAAILTHSAVPQHLPTNTRSVIAIDTDREHLEQLTHNLSLPISSDQPAYVIYTSGSTGNPKGVVGTHRASMNRFTWMWNKYPFKTGEVCCQKTNLGFVDSIWEIFGPLLASIPSVIIPEGTVRDPELMLQTLSRERVTRIVLVPSLLQALLDHAPDLGEQVPDLKLWSSSGEALPIGLAKQFRQALPDATLLNLYGSSEVAADVTYHEVNERDLASCVAIGEPISNTQIYLIDEHLNPLPAGIRGQVYVGGDGLAQGYLNREQLTSDSFVANWLSPERSARLYRTGDLGRFRANGDLEYLGRVDQQVKLRGQRIELGEIETVLATHPAIRQAVVVVSGEGEQQKLAAYLVVKDAAGVPTAADLRRHARTQLPETMVPSGYFQIQNIPLLPSGKIDRAGLTKSPATPLPDKQQIVSPRNETEAKLAEIWRELLKIDQVGIEQNFFELGGHSLLALQVTARIRRIFEIELPVRTVFEVPTIAGLAVEIEKAHALGLKARTPILQRGPESAQTLSREALLAQLDNFSASELQSLLQRVLNSKSVT